MLGVRREAMEALGKVNNVRSAEILLVALADAVDAVRWEAKRSLQMMGDSAVGPFVATLKNEDDTYRSVVARALGAGDISEVIDLFLAAMDDPYYARWLLAATFGSQALVCCGRIGRRRVLPSLGVRT